MMDKIEQMLKLIIVLFYLRGLLASHVTSIYKMDTAHSDKLCMSSATQFAGHFQSNIMCGIKCHETINCKGYYFNSVSSDCYGVDTELGTSAECQDSPGIQYFRKRDFRCHEHSLDEQSLILNGQEELSVCNMKSFRQYIHGNTGLFGDCQCNCCQWKGCFENGPLNYNGTWKWTINGRLCQRWDSQSPHSHPHDVDSKYPLDGSTYNAHNYCRDPDGTGFLWCYTTDPANRFEPCGITTC